MSKIGALLFDLDGTIVDNMGYHLEAWVEYLRPYGISDDERTVFKKVAGKTTQEVIQTYFGNNLNPEQINEHYRNKEALYKKIYLPHLKEIPGITRLLDQALALNVPMAIASAAGSDNVEFVLKNLNITHYFSAMVDAHDVKHGKPDPEIFLLAAQRLGVDPSSCLVFEDSLVGVEGAENAGMKAVAITTGNSFEKFAGYSAVIKVVDNYLDFDLQALIYQTAS